MVIFNSDIIVIYSMFVYTCIVLRYLIDININIINIANPILSLFLKIYLFIFDFFGCVGSSLLCPGFL